jgi:hypothetical protein
LIEIESPKKKTKKGRPVVLKGTNDQDRFTDAMNRVTDLLKVN